MSLYTEIRADSPAVYWPFDERVDAATCLDGSGNARHGTEAGTGASLVASGIVPGHPRSCLNSGDGYWRFTNTAALDVGTGDFTFEMWLKINNPTSDYVEIASRDTGATGNGMLLYLMTGTGYLRGYCGGTATTLGTTRISDNVLHHVVYRRISGVHSVVVDGTAQGTAAAVGSTDGVPRDLRMGVSAGIYQRPLGRWSHFAYYTTGLSNARVTAHYVAGIRDGVTY